MIKLWPFYIFTFVHARFLFLSTDNYCSVIWAPSVRKTCNPTIHSNKNLERVCCNAWHSGWNLKYQHFWDVNLRKVLAIRKEFYESYGDFEGTTSRETHSVQIRKNLPNILVKASESTGRVELLKILYDWQSIPCDRSKRTLSWLSETYCV